MRYLSTQSQWIISSIYQTVVDKWINEQTNLNIRRSSKLIAGADLNDIK